MRDTLFFRLLDDDDKAVTLSTGVEALHVGQAPESMTYVTTPEKLRQIPGSPLAYWVSDQIRQLFAKLPRFQSARRDALFGASTKNDFRFLRAWWEIEPKLAGRSRAATLNGQGWVPFATAGSYSPFYSDPVLVVNWTNDGEVIKREISEYRGSRGWGYQWSAALNGHSYYFRPGLTYGRRVRRFSPQVFPQGGIFSDSSPAIFVDDVALYLALLNATLFRFFLNLQTAVRKIEVGHVQNFPIPSGLADSKAASTLRRLGIAAYEIKRNIDRSNEVSHVFHLPALLQVDFATLQERLVHWQGEVFDKQQQLIEYQQEIDDTAIDLYGLDEEAQRVIEGSTRSGDGTASALNVSADVQEESEVAEELATGVDSRTLVADLMSYVLGCSFGRWDARIALDPSLAPDLADPFAPLPACSPGMLIGPNGLTASRKEIGRAHV